MFAPDAGNGSGGGGGNAASASGTQPSNQPDTNNPFEKLDWDSFDDETRKSLESARDNFATLQKKTAEQEVQVRTFQSEKDKAIAELNKTRQAVLGDPQQQKQETTFDRVYSQLINSGMDTNTAKAQATVLGNILEAEANRIRQQIGGDLAPLANITLGQQAETAFNQARMMDRVGAFQNPEVSQLVWNSCVEMANQGHKVDAATVKNLAAMHYYNYAEKNGGLFGGNGNGAPVPNNGSPQPGGAPVGWNSGFSFPGAMFHAQTPNHGATPSGPPLDATTKAAVDAVNNIWKGSLGTAPVK